MAPIPIIKILRFPVTKIPDDMESFEEVGRVDELAPGERKSVIVDDLPALLFRVEDDYFVIEDVCTHDGQPLTAGPLCGKEITCPRHGARFDVSTGKPLCMPATEPITRFDVEVKDGRIRARPID